MRFSWLPVLAGVAGLAIPAHAEPISDPLDTPSTTDPAASPEAAPPGENLSVRPAKPIQTTETDEPRIAVGVNVPWEWLHSQVGVSVSVGLGPHQAVRANVARYNNTGPLTAFLDEDFYKGRFIDVGVGWVFYPRRLWDGPMLEAGLNRRDRDTAESHYDGPDIQTRSVTYAARLMFGWSWRLTQHSYLAAALGFSVGREAGRETITPDQASAN